MKLDVGQPVVRQGISQLYNALRCKDLETLEMCFFNFSLFLLFPILSFMLNLIVIIQSKTFGSCRAEEIPYIVPILNVLNRTILHRQVAVGRVANWHFAL